MYHNWGLKETPPPLQVKRKTNNHWKDVHSIEESHQCQSLRGTSQNLQLLCAHKNHLILVFLKLIIHFLTDKELFSLFFFFILASTWLFFAINIFISLVVSLNLPHLNKQRVQNVWLSATAVMYLFERPHLEKYPNCHHPLKALIAPRRQMTRVSSVHPSKTRKVNIQHFFGAVFVRPAVNSSSCTLCYLR